MVLNAVFPSLLSLSLHGIDEARLDGEQLRLPHLTSLEMVYVQQADVDWGRVPALQELNCYLESVQSPNARSFSSLTRLSYLSMGQPAGLLEAGLLQLAPPSLRSMNLYGDRNDAYATALAALSGQLTRLHCSLSEMVPGLGALRHLEELGVCATAAKLTEHCALIGGLPRLRKLTCHKEVPRRVARSAHWEVRSHAAAWSKLCLAPAYILGRLFAAALVWVPARTPKPPAHLWRAPPPLQCLVNAVPNGCVVEEAIVRW